MAKISSTALTDSLSTILSHRHTLALLAMVVSLMGRRFRWSRDPGAATNLFAITMAEISQWAMPGPAHSKYRNSGLAPPCAVVVFMGAILGSQARTMVMRSHMDRQLLHAHLRG
jgi:hypothetical protein